MMQHAACSMQYAGEREIDWEASPYTHTPVSNSRIVHYCRPTEREFRIPEYLWIWMRIWMAALSGSEKGGGAL